MADQPLQSQESSLLDDARVLAARVVLAVADALKRSPSEYTVGTVTDDGRAHSIGVVFDRHSSAIAEATAIADTASVLAYSVRQNADDSFTVYGGSATIATLNTAEAARYA